MPYDKNFIVPIPKGSILAKNCNKTYVYHVVEKRYDKKRQNNSDVRVTIGIQIPNTNTMYINDNFKKYFSEVYEEKSNSDVLSNKLNFSDGITYGVTAVLHKLASNIGLLPILKNNFDEDDNLRSNSIINLATKFILTNNSSIVSYPHFARNHLILGNKIESDTALENMLGSIEEADIDSFLNDWIEHTCKDKDLVLSIDGSSVSTEANIIELVDIAYSKNKAFENQFAFSLVTEQQNYTPVYYKEYNGTIHDLNEGKKIVKILKNGKPKSINFVLDRGYFSSGLMKSLLELDYGFIMMAKNNNQLKTVLDRMIDKVNSVENYIPELDLYGACTAYKPFESINKNLYYHVYFSSEAKNEATKNLHLKVTKMFMEVKKLLGKTLTASEIKKYKKYLDLEIINNKLESCAINKTKVDTDSKYYGYFVIIASNISSPAEAYKVYHNRDYTEKLIMMMKTYEQFDCVRCHDVKHLKSKNLCLFVGLILRNEVFVRTKNLRNNCKDRKTYTTPEILNELSCIQATRDKDGKYSKKTPYTKKEKAILQALDIQLNVIEGALNRFNKNLV